LSLWKNEPVIGDPAAEFSGILLLFRDGTIHLAELHWYEAHGIGKKETKIKRLLG